MTAGNPEARIVTAAPVSTGEVVWRSRGQLYVTVIVKATFGLVNDQAMELVEPEPLVRSELHHRENPSRSVRATSDMAPYLNRADVVLTGHACAPSGEPATMVKVRLAVFREQAILDKSVMVYGDRKSGSPAPFEKIPLMYERSLGGVGFDENPMGTGMRAGGEPDLRAPNVEHATDPSKVAGFGPISRTWPARRRLLGKVDRKALDKPVIQLPDGFDWSYFQAAPHDQQIDFLRGDEWVVLEGIHPGMPRIMSRLPNVRVTGIVAGMGDGGRSGGAAGPVLRGLEFHADILRIDADAQSCNVVWRSSLPVADEAAIEALEISVALEIAGRAIEWSDGEDAGDDIDAHETMDLDESALLSDSAVIEDAASIDESDFAKTIPREDKLPEAPANRPEKTALWTPELAAALRGAPPNLDEPPSGAALRGASPSAESPAGAALHGASSNIESLANAGLHGASASVESPADAALRESLAKRAPGVSDDSTTDADTRKVKPKGEALAQEGTLKLAPVKEAFVRAPEDAPQPTEKITIGAISAPRPPLETLPLTDLASLPKVGLPFGRGAPGAPRIEEAATPKPRAPLDSVTHAGVAMDAKPSLPFAAAPGAKPSPSAAAPGPKTSLPFAAAPGPKRFDGTFALSMDDQAEAGHKAAVPFAGRTPASVPRPSGAPRAAIPGAPWGPKSKPAAPPRPPKSRLDQTVTAIGDMPVRAEPARPEMLAKPAEARSDSPSPPSAHSPDSIPSALTDAPAPVPPPIAPPPRPGASPGVPARPKLPPLKPTLPKGAPAPKVTASRETTALQSLEAAGRRAARLEDSVPVVHRGPFGVFSFPWQLKAKASSLIVVVKATCDLVADGAARLRAQADPPSGDVLEGGDAGRTLVYSTDFAVFKPRADVTLAGHVYAPSGSSPAAQARFEFRGKKGGFDRRIAAFGERRWQKAGIKLAPSEARPFKRVPIVYERAFGGPAFERNPVGIGLAGDLLPQLEDPASLVTSPGDTPEPACFAGIPPLWAARRSKLGTFDAEWKKNRWPYFPDDFDWAFFQAAPPAQQIEPPSGDEPFELVGLSADHPVVSGKLPGVRPRCFAMRAGGDFVEVLLRLDTLHFEPDAMKVTLVWRGAIDVADETAADVAELFVLEEKVAGPAIDRAEALSKYRAEKLSTAPEEITDSDPSNDAQPGRAKEPPEIVERSPEASAKLRADVEVKLAEGASFDGADLAGADLAGLDFSGRSLVNAVLARCGLAGARFGKASLSGAQMESADLRGADLVEADLTGADLDGAVLDGADLTGAKIGGASFADARARRARFAEATGERASFAGADLGEARFDRAKLPSLDLTRAKLDGAILDGAELPDVKLYDAEGKGVSMNGAKLEGARADGVRLVRSSLQRVQARSSVWDRAALDESTFLGAALAESGFAKASCAGVVFSGADLTASRLRNGSFTGASFLKANLMTATLEGADLTNADLRGANLHGAETHRATLAGAKLDLAIVTQTKLAAEGKS